MLKLSITVFRMMCLCIQQSQEKFPEFQVKKNNNTVQLKCAKHSYNQLNILIHLIFTITIVRQLLILLIFQARKPKHRNVKSFSQGYTASKSGRAVTQTQEFQVQCLGSNHRYNNIPIPPERTNQQMQYQIKILTTLAIKTAKYIINNT